MFLGGAHHADEVAIRGSSLRGALRFWWRFLAWADPKMPPSGVGERLVRLRRLETLLFGHAGSRRTSRQAALSILLVPRRTPLKIWTKDQSKKDQRLPSSQGGRLVGPGARYLGYGLMEAFASKATDSRPAKKAGELTRPCILTDQGFKVHFRLTPPGDLSTKELEDDFNLAVDIFRRALRLFGLVGGLGSRARRGWGSIALHALDGDTEPYQRPATVDDYVKAVRTLLAPSSAADARPPFTALGSDSRIEVLVPDEDEALEVLDKLGRGMQRYRSLGKRSKG